MFLKPQKDKLDYAHETTTMALETQNVVNFSVFVSICSLVGYLQQSVWIFLGPIFMLSCDDLDDKCQF